ncbi:MAG: L-2-hydroxyglutarate oxidase [Methylacidiphilales bacterium]|nr:L-2-hydroxyglutarate oxidase [Candidatus Methylacidiphilales bacterium]
MSKKVVIIGGGIVGLATAYRLLQVHPGTEVAVVEKEAGPGRHQTTHNSGVLHAGLYYKPGSLKALLAVSGIREMVRFCRDNGIAHEICGKLVVATSPEEEGRLQALHRRGLKNGLLGLRLLGRKELREIEPYAVGCAALHVPEEGIVDYAQVCACLAQKIQELGGTLLFKTRVTGLTEADTGWHIQASERETMQADFLINCAGLYSDRMAQAAGEKLKTKIVPFRGEYFKLRPERQFLVKNLIYPVPDPTFPFLGVHFTRLICGGIEAGPNAVLAFAREGYRKQDVNVRDLAESLGFDGLWRFLARHRKMCWNEFCRSWSKPLFCAALQRLVPEVRMEDLLPGGSGVRAQAMTPSGELVQDFVLVRIRNALHVINSPSPAATASLAIASEILARLDKE